MFFLGSYSIFRGGDTDVGHGMGSIASGRLSRQSSLRLRSISLDLRYLPVQERDTRQMKKESSVDDFRLPCALSLGESLSLGLCLPSGNLDAFLFESTPAFQKVTGHSV